MEQALQWVMSTIRDGFVVMDVETGGLDRFRHPVLTGGIVEFDPTGKVGRTREWLIGSKGGYTLPAAMPEGAAEEARAMSRLMRGDQPQLTRTITRQQMLETISPWSRKHILPQVEALESAGAARITGGELLQEFLTASKGRIGLIQNTKFEASALSYMGDPESYQAIGRTAEYASKYYQDLKMMPRSVSELIQGAYKTQRTSDWWSVYRGLGDEAQGGLRHALEGRGGRTMMLDLMDTTKAMLGGAKFGGLITGFGQDVHTGTNVNVLNLARMGSVVGAEAHATTADGIIEGELLLHNLTISEKMHRAQARNLKFDAFFDTNESRYLQRLGNVQEWLKFKNVEKSFAQHRLDILSGRGVSITNDVIDPFKTQVYREGLEHTEMLSNIPGRTSTREMAERVMPGAAMAEQMVYERQLIFNRFAQNMPRESLPRARQLAAKVWRLDADSLQTTAQMQLKPEEILAQMRRGRPGAMGLGEFSDDVGRIAGKALDKFKGVYEKHPTAVKATALGLIGLLAVGAARSLFHDDQPTPTVPYSTMEGIRRKQSMYSQVRGIYASSLPMGNVSDFGSGFDYEKGAIRSAAAIYANTRPPMKNFMLEFPKKEIYKQTGIIRPTEMSKPVNYPEPTPIAPQVPYQPGSEDLPPIPKGDRPQVMTSKQVMEPLPTSLIGTLANQRRMKAARTHYKLKIRETPAAEALSPYRNANGMGEVARRGMTDFGSPSDPTRKLSRRVTEDQLRPRVKAVPQQHWLVDRNVWDNEDTIMSHLEQTASTSTVRLEVGVAQRGRSISAGKLFNKINSEGIKAARSDLGLALKENDRGKLYSDHLEAVGSELRVLPQQETSRDRGMRELHQGRAGILHSRPIQHTIDSQHLRLTGSAPIRRRHPVRSRAFRSCG